MLEALFYEKRENSSVKCHLCGHGCLIPEGKRGVCCVRENRGGVLYSLNSDRLISSAVDPIEKKPMYHFLPGTAAFSVAAMGCNFRCPFCQNSSISQVACDGPVDGTKASWDDILRAALETGAPTISYTYSEPTVFYEMVKGVGEPARGKGLKNVLVTNGFMSDEAAKDMLGFIDGANVDLKFFREEGYRKYTGGNLRKVMSSIEIFAAAPSFWIEVTTLLIPGLNDTEAELRELARWLASVDKDIPWHVSRFFPQYKMTDRDATPERSLEMAYEIGREAGLNFVYLGNVRDPDREHTFCLSCHKPVIKRSGYWIDNLNVTNGKCGYCGADMPGVWK